VLEARFWAGRLHQIGGGVKDPPNLIRSGTFTLDRLLSHIEAGPQEECEEFVRRIYEQRHIDLSSDRNGKTGR